jgi:hypothetical protein
MDRTFNEINQLRHLALDPFCDEACSTTETHTVLLKTAIEAQRME